MTQSNFAPSNAVTLLAVLSLICFVNFILAVSGFTTILEGGLAGPDSYMRLLSVIHLYESGDWFDHTIPRSNAPYGELLHWTRPADLLYLTGALLLQPLFGFERALFVWGVSVGPLLHVSMIMALIWAVAPEFDPSRRFLLALGVIAQIAIWPHGILGRTDHHMLIFLAFVLALGGALRITRGAHGIITALAAGAAAGFGLWLSVESLVWISVLFAGLTVCWSRWGGEQARCNFWHALGLTVVIILGILVERPPADWWVVEYDRISVVHLMVGLLASSFWGAVVWIYNDRWAQTPYRRFLICAVGAAVAGSIMLLVFPKFFAGPEVDYDPRLHSIFLDYVSETQPLFPNSMRNAGWLLIYLGSALFAVPYVATQLWRYRDEEVWSFWLFIALGLLVYLPLAMSMRRFAGFAAILIAVLVADLLSSVLASIREHSLMVRLLVPASAVFVIFFAPVAVGQALLTSATAKRSGGCQIVPLIRELNRTDGLGAQPLTVLAMVNFGPRLMYDTPHRVITTPYPRNSAGQLAAFEIYAATNLEDANQLVEDRGIDLIVTCVKTPMYGALSAAPNTLDSQLRRGMPPDWLQPIPIGDEASREVSIFRVQRPSR